MNKQRRRQKKDFRLPVGIAAVCALAALLVAAHILVRAAEPKAVPAGREVTILAQPQTLQRPFTVTLEPTATPVPTPVPTPTPRPTPEPPFEYLPVVQKANTGEKKIAITVDDCYQLNNLEALCELTVRAGGELTIFPIGETLTMPGMKSILRKYVFDYGFQVENHTYSHARVFRLSEAEMAEEIWRQSDALNRALGVNYRQSFFRLMGGDGKYDQRTHNYLRQLGYKGIADWTVSGSDAEMGAIKAYLEPGAVYLFHTTDADMQKLREFIPYAVSEGYELVTLNELLGLPANIWSDLSTAETSAPAPVSYRVEYRDQQMGDYSWSVVEIQSRLMELGYLDESAKSAVKGTAADGVYGQGTADAVAAFQTNAGLEATGIADVATQRALFGK